MVRLRVRFLDGDTKQRELAWKRFQVIDDLAEGLEVRQAGEGVVCEALRRCGATDDMVRKFARIHTPHVMTNFRAFDKLGLLSPTPTMGALWLAQHGTTDSGHEGVVKVPFVRAGRMGTVEGNTSAGPAETPAKDRDGDWITEKERNHTTNGRLRTRGFISVASILKMVYA